MENCEKKIEQYVFMIIEQQIIDPNNIISKDFSPYNLPNWILSQLGFKKFRQKKQFTETTYDIGMLLFFLQNPGEDRQEDPIETVSAFAVSCELEKLKRKKLIKDWKSSDPLDLNSKIKIEY